MTDRLTLGFDTSAAHCAAALVSGDRVLAARAEPMAKGQAERLMPLLEALLAEGGVRWSDLGALGVGTGPGNFTGTRIAVACARGLALALDVPAEGVGAVEALADGRAVTVCLPAPRGTVHVGWGDAVVTVGDGETLPDGWPRALTGPAAEALAGRIGGPVHVAPPLAEAIAWIAARRAAQGRPRPAPIYLRPADAAPAADPPPRLL